MSYENKELLAKTQGELEIIATKEQAKKITKEHLELSKKNYYSATQHGRSLTSGQVNEWSFSYLQHYLTFLYVPNRWTLQEFASCDVKAEANKASRLDVLSSIIRFRIENLKAKTTGHKETQELLYAIDMAIKRGEQTDDKGHLLRDKYGATDAADVVACIALKTAVDALAIGDTGDNSVQWPYAQAVWQRMGDRMHLQFLDALTFAITPDGHQDQKSRTKKKHQTPKNRRTNALLGQKFALDAAGYDIAKFKWTAVQQSELGAFITDCVLALDLIKIQNDVRKGKEEPPRRVVPQAHILDNFEEVMSSLAEGRLVSYPMIQKPQRWIHQEGPGINNTTGGYYAESSRTLNPLCRSQNGNNATVPSKKVIRFLNVLGKTALVPNQPMMDALLWAVDNKYAESGLPVAPEKTVADLDKEKAAFMAEINANGRAEGVPLQGTPEHSEWKKSRRDAYEDAIDKTMRFIRTRAAEGAIKHLRQLKRIFFSWSVDYRCRAYPQQQQISPQGTDYETSLLRFEEGEFITTDQQRQEIHRAIGAAFLGTRDSYEVREKWAIDNLPTILEAMSKDEPDPRDLGVLVKDWDPDETWMALALVLEYKRAVIGDEKWHLPIAVDAAQSGLQLLSGLLKDQEGLENTNVLRAKDNPWTTGPVDGYEKVGEQARHLLMGDDELRTELMGKKWTAKFADMSLQVAYQIRDLLNHKKSRRMFKIATMPKPYGIKWASVHRGIRQFIAQKLHIDLNAKGAHYITGILHIDQERAKDNWSFASKTTCGLTSFLDAGVELTYPKAIQALKWLRALAATSLSKQIEAHLLKYSDAEEIPPFIPTLKWKLSDGTVCDYWITEPLTKSVISALAGRLITVVGNGDEPKKNKILSAFAPGFVHSLDALILREAFHDWKGPLITIHDSQKCLPSRMPELRKRVWKAYKSTVKGNPLMGLAKQMGINPEDLPELPMGKADLENAELPQYMLH